MTREASARVSALRAQNYEEYLRLATHAKDSRLRTLLEKTNAILTDLGHKVRGAGREPMLAKRRDRNVNILNEEAVTVYHIRWHTGIQAAS